MKKTTFTLAATMAALVSSASAFNIDFSSYLANGETLGSKTINVAGYGDIFLSAAIGSSLEQSATALQFDNNDSLVVQFLGDAVTSVGFDYTGMSVGETFNIIETIPGQFLLSLTNSTDGVGLRGVSFTAATAVPEPSTALFGMIAGLGMLFVRRR